MSAACKFEPGARDDYHAAIRFYAAESGDTRVAARFVDAIDLATHVICAAPEVWRLVEAPDVRRYVLRRFPFVLYYRYQAGDGVVVVYAIMHTSRQLGYWRERLPPRT